MFLKSNETELVLREFVYIKNTKIAAMQGVIELNVCYMDVEGK